jgi:hypothetical protein
LGEEPKAGGDYGGSHNEKYCPKAKEMGFYLDLINRIQQGLCSKSVE